MELTMWETKINKSSDEYKANYRSISALINELNEKQKFSLFQGDEKTLKRVEDSDKLLTRHRIEYLLDQDSPFLELLSLAGVEEDEKKAGGNLVAGIGFVSKKLCMIVANTATKKGGATDFISVQKAERIYQIIDENELPTINLVESAGLFLQEQDLVFNRIGSSFRDITRRSKRQLTTISVVFGNCTAGGAYVPGMSDYSIFVKGNAKVFLAGPPLVKMATGEISDDESLGGADMHSSISGVADYIAKDDKDAIRLAREVMLFIKPKANMLHLQEKIIEPFYPIDELKGILSTDIKKPIDSREIVVRIVDGSEFHEFKVNYGKTLITAYAKIFGFPVGIIANNGVLFSDSANKGAQFIQLCNQQNIPLLFLQNITGFMVGKKYEQEGIIKHGAKMINAVSNSTVPSITLMIGASFGAGNYAMNGRTYSPRFLFSYPNSVLSVMGSEQLSGVLDIIARAGANKGKTFDEAKAQKEKEATIHDIEKKSTAFYSTSRMWDDGIIDPMQTREVLGYSLYIMHSSKFTGTTSYGVFRM